MIRALQRSVCRCLRHNEGFTKLIQKLKNFLAANEICAKFCTNFFVAVDIDFGISMVFFNRYISLILSLYISVYFSTLITHTAQCLRPRAEDLSLLMALGAVGTYLN